MLLFCPKISNFWSTITLLLLVLVATIHKSRYYLSSAFALVPSKNADFCRFRGCFVKKERISVIDRLGSVKGEELSLPLPHLSTESIEELNHNGYVVLNEWLSDDLVQELRQDVKDLRSKGKFQVAKIGQDSTNKLNTDIRVAETCFLGIQKLQDVPCSARSRLYQILETLRQDLSGNEILNQVDNDGNLIKGAPALDASLSELLYAYYPKGGFYRRHMDAVENSASILRTYSLLLYLNHEWTSKDGGCLRVHLDSGKDFIPHGEEPSFLDVEPRGGTLVLFKSDCIPHEVLDTTSERMAVVGWFNRPLTSADVNSLATKDDKKRAVMLLVSLSLIVYGVISILL